MIVYVVTAKIIGKDEDLHDILPVVFTTFAEASKEKEIMRGCNIYVDIRIAMLQVRGVTREAT